MGTSGYGHLRYDLNKYISELKRISLLAETFLFSDSLIKNTYLDDINYSVLKYEKDFNLALDSFQKMRIVNELKADVQLTEKEYQILRRKDYITYIVTDIFEDQGVIRYAKISGGVLSGTLQTYMGGKLFFLGKKLHIKHFQGVGAVLFSQGINNTYEALSPLVFEAQQSGTLRSIYRKCAEMAGFDKDDGDLAYSMVDFAVSLYSGVRMPVLKGSEKRFVEKIIGAKPGTGRLFYYINKDFMSKWDSRSTKMKVFFTANSIYKARLEFYDGGYEKNY